MSESSKSLVYEYCSKNHIETPSISIESRGTEQNPRFSTKVVLTLASSVIEACCEASTKKASENDAFMLIYSKLISKIAAMNDASQTNDTVMTESTRSTEKVNTINHKVLCLEAFAKIGLDLKTQLTIMQDEPELYAQIPELLPYFCYVEDWTPSQQNVYGRISTSSVKRFETFCYQEIYELLVAANRADKQLPSIVDSEIIIGKYCSLLKTVIPKPSIEVLENNVTKASFSLGKFEEYALHSKEKFAILFAKRRIAFRIMNDRSYHEILLNDINGKFVKFFSEKVGKDWNFEMRWNAEDLKWLVSISIENEKDEKMTGSSEDKSMKSAILDGTKKLYDLIYKSYPYFFPEFNEKHTAVKKKKNTDNSDESLAVECNLEIPKIDQKPTKNVELKLDIFDGFFDSPFVTETTKVDSEGHLDLNDFCFVDRKTNREVIMNSISGKTMVISNLPLKIINSSIINIELKIFLEELKKKTIKFDHIKWIILDCKENFEMEIAFAACLWIKDKFNDPPRFIVFSLNASLIKLVDSPLILDKMRCGVVYYLENVLRILKTNFSDATKYGDASSDVKLNDTLKRTLHLEKNEEGKKLKYADAASFSVKYDLIEALLAFLCRKQDHSGNILVFMPDMESIATLTDILLNQDNYKVGYNKFNCIHCEDGVYFRDDLNTMNCVIICFDSYIPSLSIPIGVVIDSGLSNSLFGHYRIISKAEIASRNMGQVYFCLADCGIEIPDSYPPQSHSLDVGFLCANIFRFFADPEEILPYLPVYIETSKFRNEVKQLQMIGLADENNLNILGISCLSFPIHPQLSAMLVRSVVWKCVESVAIIAATIHVGNPIKHPLQLESRKHLLEELKISFVSSEHMLIVKVFNSWNQGRFDESLLESIGFNFDKMKEIKECFNYFMTILSKSPLYLAFDDLSANNDNEKLIVSIIAASYPDHYLTLTETGYFKNRRNLHCGSDFQLPPNRGFLWLYQQKLIVNDVSIVIGVDEVNPLLAILLSSDSIFVKAGDCIKVRGWISFKVTKEIMNFMTFKIDLNGLILQVLQGILKGSKVEHLKCSLFELQRAILLKI